MRLKLISAPAKPPISRAEAKKQVGATSFDDDDEYLEALVSAATSQIEGKYGFLGIALVQQTWDLYLDEFPTCEIKIPLPPLQSVSHVKYDDEDGIEQTIDEAEYTVDAVSEPGWIFPATSWPSTFEGINSVRIRFVAGWPVVNDVPTTPDAIKHAIRLIIGHWYKNREDVSALKLASIPKGADALLANFKNWS
jgi:uncharacterized phiE125 gp8 family phage protein